jgi:hypothetical protein
MMCDWNAGKDVEAAAASGDENACRFFQATEKGKHVARRSGAELSGPSPRSRGLAFLSAQKAPDNAGALNLREEKRRNQYFAITGPPKV